RSGRLALPNVHVETAAVLDDRDDVRDMPGQYLYFPVQCIEGEDAWIVALQATRRVEQILERCDDLALHPVGGLRQRLHDEVVAITVHDQGRQAVSFAVDQAAGLGPPGHCLAPAEGGGGEVRAEGMG